MSLIIPFIPGIIAILIGIITFIKRRGYKKVKANIMTREHIPLQKSSNGKMLYVATYVYEFEGKRIESRNEKIKTTAEEWEYVYLNEAGEIVDNASNRTATLFGFGIAWIVAIFVVLKMNLI